MSDPTPGSWQPDPFGRFAQRYWNGSDWTANVIDASGQQATDPPVSWVPPTTPVAGSVTPGPKPPAIVLALAGLVCVLLSVFVLNWFELSARDKEDVRAESNSTVKRELGLSASEIVDGLNLSEMRTIVDKTEGNTLSAATEQYLSFGYLVAAGATALGVVVLFASGFRRPVAVVLLAIAGWHINTVSALSDDSGDTNIGAWLGAVGLVMVAAALLWPRRQAAPTGA